MRRSTYLLVGVAEMHPGGTKPNTIKLSLTGLPVLTMFLPHIKLLASLDGGLYPMDFMVYSFVYFFMYS